MRKRSPAGEPFRNRCGLCGSERHTAPSCRQKFAGFDRALAAAKRKEFEVLVVQHPEVLGDTYKELVANLNLIADAGVSLYIVPRKERSKTVDDGRSPHTAEKGVHNMPIPKKITFTMSSPAKKVHSTQFRFDSLEETVSVDESGKEVTSGDLIPHPEGFATTLRNAAFYIPKPFAEDAKRLRITIEAL